MTVNLRREVGRGTIADVLRVAGMEPAMKLVPPETDLNIWTLRAL
jgi:hypothetical protein